MNIMTSLQGIGRDRRIWLLTERKGQIRKCRDHTKLIAVAGLDRAIYQSGTYERAWQQGRTASPRVGRDT